MASVGEFKGEDVKKFASYHKYSIGVSCWWHEFLGYGAIIDYA